MYKRLLLFLFIVFPSIVISQELSYNHYTVDDGLAQMQIEDLLLDSQGALWIATRGGVSRFNGYSFDSFEDLPIKPGYCTEIVEDSNGDIFVLGSDGLYIFDGSKFKFSKGPNNMRFNQMSYMTVDDEDVVWINTQNSTPIIFYDSTFVDVKSLHPELELDSVRQVYFHEPSKRLLISIYQKGIFELIKDSLVPILKTDKHTLIYYDKLKRNDPSNVFIREFYPSGSSIYDLDDSLDSSLYIEENLGEISYIREPVKHDFIFIDHFKENLFIIEKGDTVSKKLISDLNSKFNFPGEVYLDDEGNIFLESDKGLININASRFEKLEKDKAKNVWTINQTENGDILFGGYGSGIKLYNRQGQEQQIQFNNEKFCDKRELSVELKHIYMGSAKGPSGELIIPAANSLIKYDENSFSIFDYDETCDSGMPSLFVFSDIENRRFLSATCRGLRILDENGDLLRIVKEGLFEHRCLLSINKDQEDKYWVGATGGIAKYDFETEEIKNYTQDNGGFPYKGVICTYIDYKGTLWAGSREGLTYLDKEKDKFVALEGFRGVEVASMIIGDESQLFLSTAGALIEADLKSFYSDGKMLHRVYDKNNGLGIIGSGQNGFFKDADDKIWCTSDTEVYRFDPKNLKGNIDTPIPNVISINGHRVSNTTKESDIQIPEGTNNLTLEYESIGLNASNNLKYSYLLKGYNDEWSSFAKYNNCTYNNLGSGDYIFMVKNNQSELISTQKISIDIPLHREPSFGGVAGIAAVSLLLLSLLLGRTYRLAKRNNQLLKSQEQQLKTEKNNLEELSRLEQENKILLEEQNELLIFEKSELEGINQKLRNDIKDIKKKQSAGAQKIEIRTKGNVNYVSTSNLLYVQAEGNGCRYYLKDKTSIWNDEKLKGWEDKLVPNNFVRIHRSTLVQKEYISKISYDKLSLVDGTELKIGRKYKGNL